MNSRQLFLQPQSVRIRRLCQLILPNIHKSLSRKLTKIIQENNLTKKDSFSARLIQKQLSVITQQYKCKLRLLSDPNTDCGYFGDKKLIELSFEDKNLSTTLMWLSHAFSHELAHHLQEICYHTSKEDPVRTFKEYLEYEREAEALAYYICRAYFSEAYKAIGYKITKQQFHWYKRNQKEIQQLKKYYEEETSPK